jgi:hypothetical protein
VLGIVMNHPEKCPEANPSLRNLIEGLQDGVDYAGHSGRNVDSGSNPN